MDSPNAGVAPCSSLKNHKSKIFIKLIERSGMAYHNDLGKEGEVLAVQWLGEKGFTIMHRNWRFSYYEIDIVAKKDKYLHFIEVKARNFSPVGYPEDSVSKKKFKNLQRAADEYLFQHPGHPWIQYDILAITFHTNKKPEYFFIEDVFL